VVGKNKNLVVEETGVEQETIRIKIHFRFKQKKGFFTGAGLRQRSGD